MILLKNRDFNTDIDYEEALETETWDELLDALEGLGFEDCSGLDKYQLVSKMVVTMYGEMGMILNKLSDEDWDIARRLVDMGPNTYVEMPILPDSCYDVQKYYLVFSYVDKERGVYQMMMPDEVRRECEVCLEEFWEENYTPFEHSGRFINFLPVFTPKAAIPVDKSSPQAWRMITDSVMQWITMMDYCFYNNVYLLKDVDEHKVYMVCSLGNVINSIYQYDALRQAVAVPLSEKDAKIFPLVNELMNRSLRDCADEICLKAYGFNNQPREWFLIKEMGDADEWKNIRESDPFGNLRYRNAGEEMYATVSNVVKELYNSGEVFAISALNQYMKISFKNTILRF